MSNNIATCMFFIFGGVPDARLAFRDAFRGYRYDLLKAKRPVVDTHTLSMDFDAEEPAPLKPASTKPKPAALASQPARGKSFQEILDAMPKRTKYGSSMHVDDVIEHFRNHGSSVSTVAVGGFKFNIHHHGKHLVAVKPNAQSAKMSLQVLHSPEDADGWTTTHQIQGRTYKQGGIGINSRLQTAMNILASSWHHADGDTKKLYQAIGKSGNCAICGAGLSDPLSQSRGIGPECIKRVNEKRATDAIRKRNLTHGTLEKSVESRPVLRMAADGSVTHSGQTVNAVRREFAEMRNRARVAARQADDLSDAMESAQSQSERDKLYVDAQELHYPKWVRQIGQEYADRLLDGVHTVYAKRSKHVGRNAAPSDIPIHKAIDGEPLRKPMDTKYGRNVYPGGSLHTQLRQLGIEHPDEMHDAFVGPVLDTHHVKFAADQYHPNSVTAEYDVRTHADDPVLARAATITDHGPHIEIHRDLFDIEKPFQGKKFSRVTDAGINDLAHKIHARTQKPVHITMHANLDVGGYAWAKAGFKFNRNVDRDWLSRHMKMIADKHLADGRMLPEHHTEITAHLNKLVQDHADPIEFSKIGMDHPTMGNFTHAQVDRRADHAQANTPYHFGKAAMLGSSWHAKHVIGETP